MRPHANLTKRGQAQTHLPQGPTLRKLSGPPELCVGEAVCQSCGLGGRHLIQHAFVGLLGALSAQRLAGAVCGLPFAAPAGKQGTFLLMLGFLLFFSFLFFFFLSQWVPPLCSPSVSLCWWAPVLFSFSLLQSTSISQRGALPVIGVSVFTSSIAVFVAAPARGCPLVPWLWWPGAVVFLSATGL